METVKTRQVVIPIEADSASEAEAAVVEMLEELDVADQGDWENARIAKMLKAQKGFNICDKHEYDPLSEDVEIRGEVLWCEKAKE